ncbi:MAG: phosphate/phosphite/phosphonate ABC transporter substrate-binding protein [Polyangia bacterium]
MRKPWPFMTCITLTLALASSALAGPRDFVVEHAGVGGTSEQAAPYLAKFLEYAEQTLGWPAKGSSAQFFAEPNAAFLQYLAEKKPGLGMIDPDQFLALRSKESLVLLATVYGKNQSLGHLNLVVKSPALKTLPDLKGKSLISSHLQSPKYLSKIVFAGKIDVDSYFGKLVPATSMLKAVKAVDRGEADAALLSDDEVTALKSMAYAGLHVMWTSPALPPMPVVGFAKNSSAKDRAAFAKMLLGMCADPKGGEVCKALDIEKFGPPAKAAYEAAEKRYGK